MPRVTILSARLPPKLRHFYILPSFSKKTIDQAQHFCFIDQALRVEFLRHSRGFTASFRQRSVIPRGDISRQYLLSRLRIQARVHAGCPPQCRPQHVLQDPTQAALPLFKAPQRRSA